MKFLINMDKKRVYYNTLCVNENEVVFGYRRYDWNKI